MGFRGKTVKLVVPGETGLDVEINFSSKLTPQKVRAWMPVARIAVALADQIRERVTKDHRGPNREFSESGLWRTGGMWKSLRVHVTQKHAVVSFKGKSAPAGATSMGRHPRPSDPLDIRSHRRKKGRKRGELFSLSNKMGMVERRDDGKLVKVGHMGGQMDADYIRRFYRLTEGQELSLQEAIEASKKKVLNSKKAAYSQKWLDWSILQPSNDEFEQVIATVEEWVPRQCIEGAITYATQQKTYHRKLKQKLKRNTTKLRRVR